MYNSLYPVIRETAISGLMAFMERKDYRANLTGIGFIAFAGPLLLVAIIFLAAGLFFLVEPLHGTGPALLITGLVVLTLALLSYVTGRRLTRRRRLKPPVYTREQLAVLIDDVARDVESQMSDTVRESPKIAVSAAILAGFIAGREILPKR